MLAILALATLSVAQSHKPVNFSTSIGSNGAYDLLNFDLCNSTFDKANATGIYSFDPGVIQGTYNSSAYGVNSRTLPEAAWALTIADVPNKNDANYGLQWGLFFSTGGANYSDDIHRGFDACAIVLDADQLYNNTIYRGQSDNGSCYQTFDQPCLDALNNAVQTYAGWYDSWTPSNKNLTNSSLPGVCDSIYKSLNSKLPDECRYFINTTIDWVDGGYALTQSSPASNVSNIDDSCYINGTNSTHFSNVGWLITGDYSNEAYDYLASSVLPIITVYMPTANSFVSTSNNYISSTATCIHVDHFNSGSRVTPALPTPTAVDYGGKRGLSGGAIAGIVIGCVVGVLLLILAVLFAFNCCGVRRRLGRSKTTPAKDPVELHSDTQPTEVASKESKANELSPQSYKSSELPSATARSELEGVDRKLELDSSRPPAELMADVPEKIR